MWERGCFPATILEQLRRPCRPRHPYAVPRTSLQCVCTRRRNCIAQLSPSREYALRTVDFPARNSAPIELTRYSHGSGSRRIQTKNHLRKLAPRERSLSKCLPCAVPLTYCLRTVTWSAKCRLISKRGWIILFGGARAVPYKIVAERDGKTVRTDRISLLIAVARARVWSSEGWNVVVTDGDGTQLDPAKFDQL